MSQEPVGWPLEELDDPLALEVHPAIDAPPRGEGLGVLPAYVPRAHDEQLKEVVERVAAGASDMAVLVGGSSTGKTRACWEALRHLPPGWRLWHPIDPSRPEAVLAAVQRVGPRTVVWLNEAQHYLAASEVGERVGAGLRELLRDPRRGPVLVLGTLWPEHWTSLTATPTSPAAPDPHAHTRFLLTGTDILVPVAFTDEELVRARELAERDTRWTAALKHAEEGQVTQFLAGAPMLLERYRTAPPLVRALSEVAMDARRLGYRPLLPRAVLAQAAFGYLTAVQQDTLLPAHHDPQQWEEERQQALASAIAEAARPARGSRGPLTVVRPNPQHAEGPITDTAYRLADFLEQTARREHLGQVPPSAFWKAAIDHADAIDQAHLAQVALRQDLVEHAVPLAASALRGDPGTIYRLGSLLGDLAPEEVESAAERAPTTSPDRLAAILWKLRKVGMRAALDTLACRVAPGVPLNDARGLADLLGALLASGLHRTFEQVATPAAAEVLIHDPWGLTSMLATLREANMREAVEVLAARAAPEVPVEDPSELSQMLRELSKTGARSALEVLAARVAADAPTAWPSGVAALLREFRKVDAHTEFRVLAERAVPEVALHNPFDLADLLEELREASASARVEELLARDPAAHVLVALYLRIPNSFDGLLAELHKVGAHEAHAKLEARIQEQT